MARDLFGDVTRPFHGVGARSRLTVPLSIVAHSAAVVALVVVPLLATSALPALRESVSYTAVTPVVPPPPPRPPVARPARTAAANTNAAPLDTPGRIDDEPAWQHDPIATVNDGTGIVDGIEHGDELLAPPPPPVRNDPVPVGGRVTAPTRTHYVAPVYAAIAQLAHVSGLVIIQATIGVDGAVVDARVLRSVPLLDEAALTAVRQWRYTPTQLNGAPVAVIMTVTVNFELR